MVMQWRRRTKPIYEITIMESYNAEANNVEAKDTESGH